MRTLANRRDIESLLARVEQLHPESPRAWGTMTPAQAIMHLSDSFDTMTGDKRMVTNAESGLNRTVIKYLALYAPIPWPHGTRTMPEVDARRQGTPPREFLADRTGLIERMRRFAERTPDAAGIRHPLFGPLSRAQWLRWGYLHMDHHLRQFGC